MGKILTFSNFLNNIIQTNSWIYTKEFLEKLRIPLPTEQQLKSFDVANAFYKEFLCIVYSADIISMLNSMKIWAANNSYDTFTDLTLDMIPIIWLGEGYYGIVEKNKTKTIMPCALYQYFDDLYINFPVSNFSALDICEAYKKLFENEENVAMNIIYAKTIEDLKREFNKNFKDFDILFEGPDYYDLYFSPVSKRYIVAPIREILKTIFEHQLIYFHKLLNIHERFKEK
ncbi:hypothetical protein [Caldicellulosiruptor naganoensis]|uniref:Uncharacterized protein n=1 Tax=Caldicellulosiruptor naganoensis TaxID=29324 RepID=A0ABY7BKP3_9FIRM|nr:hypothetical protein [Caldicellulosiruptor naganoensis]WAM31591.1 hypothetical protein OTJ99_000015 [Caldicellulosiruptor naganoensis]